jgi:hypothetical protein
MAIAQCEAWKRKGVPSERLLEFAGYRVIPRPTVEAGDEIGSAVWIVPDEGVDIIVAACGTGCEGDCRHPSCFSSLYSFALDRKSTELATHENPGAKFEMTPEMAGEAEF